MKYLTEILLGLVAVFLIWMLIIVESPEQERMHTKTWMARFFKVNNQCFFIGRVVDKIRCTEEINKEIEEETQRHKNGKQEKPYEPTDGAASSPSSR